MPYITQKNFPSFSDGIKGLVADGILIGCSLRPLTNRKECEVIEALSDNDPLHHDGSNKGCVEMVEERFHLKQIQPHESSNMKKFLVTGVFGAYGYLYFGWLRKDKGYLFFAYTETGSALGQPRSAHEKRQEANRVVSDYIFSRGVKGGWRREFYNN